MSHVDVVRRRVVLEIRYLSSIEANFPRRRSCSSAGANLKRITIQSFRKHDQLKQRAVNEILLLVDLKPVSFELFFSNVGD